MRRKKVLPKGLRGKDLEFSFRVYDFGQLIHKNKTRSAKDAKKKINSFLKAKFVE